MRNRIIQFPIFLLLVSAFLIFETGHVTGQSKPAYKKSSVQSRALKINMEQQLIIDSLTLVIDDLNGSLVKSDSLFQNEKLVSADLRDQLLKLDDYRQRLEQNNDSFKGENLKLNQSNRILIIFNSLVAVLLVVTLVFFLKRINRKKAADTDVNPGNEQPSKKEPPVATRFAGFEDRLMQLERLGKLREKGLLSEEEFIAEKHKILGK